MFNSLTEKLHQVISGIGGKKKLTEDNIQQAVREVRLALLEADVNYSVASTFVKRVKEKSLGEAVLQSVKPKEQFIKIVHDELTALMGSEEAPLKLDRKPFCIMLCGLQGSGKTTHAAKLAYYISQKHKDKKVLIAACDLQRPAAILQLQTLASKIGIEVFTLEGEKKALKVAKKAHAYAKDEGFDVLILDTAGRLHIDKDLMQELADIKKAVNPSEVLFVANATTGQDAVKTAQEFDSMVSITGSILTMLDSDARAGAAISILEVTQKPLKFEGIGEKVEDLQIFNPKSMADRILGMGDIINLVRKAESAFDEEETKKIEKKLKKATFNYSDYLKQMGMIKKMGSFKSLLKMMPGASMAADFNVSDKEFQKMEAMILSMTLKERDEKVDFTFTRRKRVAKGSGAKIDDVNRMVKGFKRIKQLFKKMPQLKKQGSFQDLQQTIGKTKWH